MRKHEEMFVKEHIKYWKLFFTVIGVLLSVQLVADESKKVPANENKKFNLITVLYNETNLHRINEYKECLNRNLQHPSIKAICVVYDTSWDNRSRHLPLLDFIKSQRVILQYVTKRPTYGFVFSLADELFPKGRIIISNGDIYFNETLGMLEDYDLKGKFLALTRWHVTENGGLRKDYAPDGKPGIGSQDAWIYETPLPPFERLDIELGAVWCDSCLMYQAHKAGLEVINPCLTIQCCHLHLTRVRHQGYPCNLPKEYYVQWSEL